MEIKEGVKEVGTMKEGIVELENPVREDVVESRSQDLGEIIENMGLIGIFSGMSAKVNIIMKKGTRSTGANSVD